MSSPAPTPLLGRTIAQRYRLISRLGAGSVAEVFLARHVLIDRLSAIKIVSPELMRDPVWRERFLREARAVNRINHPNIVEITDYGEADGLVFLVMEYVPGESLRQILERGPIGWRRAAVIGKEIASALGRAHEMGVVHRDLKPGNVLLVEKRGGGDLVKLTDFGVAKLVGAAPLTVRAPSGPATLIGPGRFIEAYAAPELIELSDVDTRADLFALGVTLYEATSGALPSPGERLRDRAPETPAFFEEVVSTLLAPNPDDRPRDGFEAADLLRRALEQDAPQSARPSVPPSMRSGPPSARPSQAPPSTDPPVSGPAEAFARAPITRLAALCDGALHTVEEAIDDATGDGHPPSAETLAALEDAQRAAAAVQAVSDLVTSDGGAREAVQARGRATLAELGKKLDEAAREHSKALGWAGTIAERSYQVEAQRLSGEHPVHAVEAMVWEQAALEQEEDRARERAARLANDMHVLRRAIDRHNERMERELEVVSASLEGRIAALRSLAAEAHAAITRAASLAGVPDTGFAASI
ncbi:Serine/threonine protein kinase [Minicystis rosea]|nr:Serine/threonine protein kinase [Minicystis rosea]